MGVVSSLSLFLFLYNYIIRGHGPGLWFKYKRGGLEGWGLYWILTVNKIMLLNNCLSWQATWHKGHSLAQTVFSCAYLVRPERTLSHALLDSYCKVIRATCKAVTTIVSDARTHEVKYFNISFNLCLFCVINPQWFLCFTLLLS